MTLHYAVMSDAAPEYIFAMPQTCARASASCLCALLTLQLCHAARRRCLRQQRQRMLRGCFMPAFLLHASQ